MAKLILFNKPFNVLSQFTDENARDTLKLFLTEHNDVYPAGRLDYDSEGLLLLTDNGILQHQISHPKNKQDKTYWVQVEGSVIDNALQPLREGITLKDGPCRPAKVHIINEPTLWERVPPIRKRLNIPTSWLEITINEGKNRQVRRMTAAIGYPTLRLVRARIGDWTIDNLAPGEYRVITVANPVVTKKNHLKPTHKTKRAQTRRTTRRKDTL